MAKIYKPLPEGCYNRNRSLICVTDKHNQLSISGISSSMEMWVGDLPDNWKLCEGVEVGDRAVPDDIRDIIRHWRNVVKRRADAYVKKTDLDLIGRILAAEVAQVDAWLNSLPGASDGNANTEL